MRKTLAALLAAAIIGCSDEAPAPRRAEPLELQVARAIDEVPKFVPKKEFGPRPCETRHPYYAIEGRGLVLLGTYDTCIGGEGHGALIARRAGAYFIPSAERPDGTKEGELIRYVRDGPMNAIETLPVTMKDGKLYLPARSGPDAREFYLRAVPSKLRGGPLDGGR